MSLKNCPFCGGAAEIEELQGGSNRVNYLVECTNAGSDCPMAVCSGSYDNREEAITAWNTRAAPPMKKWEWEVQSGDEWFTCLIVEPTYKAKVTMCAGSSVWRAHVDGKYFGEFMFCNAAKNACKIFVENKLKEWLV